MRLNRHLFREGSGRSSGGSTHHWPQSQVLWKHHRSTKRPECRLSFGLMVQREIAQVRVN
jgi:hypothetical protein